MRRILIFTLVAALVLTPLDALHVLFGVRTLGPMPWITPLKFALLGGVLGFLSFCLAPKPHKAGTKAVVLHGLLFAAAYASTVIFVHPTHIIAALAVLYFIQDILSKYVFKVNNVEVFPFLLLLATVGPFLEWLSIRVGGFEYVSTPGTIPYWLPLLWASGAFFARSLVGREAREPGEYKWIGHFITFIAPAAKAIATAWYAFDPKNIKRLGFKGSIKMALRLYGWTKDA